MTAVDYLIEQMIYQMGIRIENTTVGCELFQKSKELEKQHIINALHYFGIEGAGEYYEKTFNRQK